MNRRIRSWAAFTLIELLAVVAIIGILAALVMPGFAKIQEGVNGLKCVNNLKQIGTAMTAFAGENDGVFPVSGGAIAYGETDPQTRQAGWTQQLEMHLPTNNGKDLRIYRCPTTSKRFASNKNYSYFSGCRAAYDPVGHPETIGFEPLRQSLIKYPSKYILCGDISSENMFLANDADRDDYTETPPFSGDMTKMHNGKSNILFADGHVAGFSTFDYSMPAGTAGTDSDTRSLTVWYDQVADYSGKR
jgi:prepilin-type processing-associated H-X9-DG protein/prepilin-type N-terminal cleavage/methylation domain-containing protein